MIDFRPNAFDITDLSQPARQALYAAIMLGLQHGDLNPYAVPIETFIRLAGLPSTMTSAELRTLMKECTKALGLLDPEDPEDDDEDTPTFSCPVFMLVAMLNGEVVFQLSHPILRLSERGVKRLLPL